MIPDYPAMTGMPLGKPKTRRGGRKGRGPDHHMANLQAAMKTGDHGAAKSHALSLANALHASSKGKVPAATSSAPAEPDVDDTAGPADQPIGGGTTFPRSAGPSASPSSSGLGKLAAILRAKKK
jgi:hypothetical protein